MGMSNETKEIRDLKRPRWATFIVTTMVLVILAGPAFAETSYEVKNRFAAGAQNVLQGFIGLVFGSRMDKNCCVEIHDFPLITRCRIGI